MGSFIDALGEVLLVAAHLHLPLRAAVLVHWVVAVSRTALDEADHSHALDLVALPVVVDAERPSLKAMLQTPLGLVSI